MPSPNILIASSSFDRPLIEPVARELVSQGYDVTAYEADAVVHGVDPLTIRIDDAGTVEVSYKGKPLTPSSVAAAWYRRPNQFFPSSFEDPARYASLSKEYSDAQAFLWGSVPDTAWLNHPDAMRLASRKLQQLVAARSIGFHIPETVVTNDWSDVMGISSEELTLKSVSGIFSSKDGTRFLYSQRLLNQPGALPVHASPYPGIWQPYLAKAREWRITVVGNEVFDAAIYTTDEAKDDWRQHQASTAVEFKAEPFPDEEKSRCLEYLGHWGLRFGAFDFIESPSGKVTFLELNPNGQYGMAEQRLGLPISPAIASELGKIAQGQVPSK